MNLSNFLRDLEVRAYSPRTINNYRLELERFQRFLKQHKLRLSQVKARHIQQYVAERASSRAPSQRRALAALTTFFRTVEITSNGRIRNPCIPIPRPRKEHRLIKAPNEEVLDQLIRGVTNDRDKAILMLLRSSGLRLSELTDLDVGSITVEKTDLGRGTERILGVGTIIGKGNKERQFLVDQQTLRQIWIYLAKRKKGSGPLFLSNRNKRISQRMVQVMIATWCERLGLPRLEPHDFRRAFATRAIRSGMKLLDLSSLLGHASVSTTQRYVTQDPSSIRAQYFAAMER
jgi:integrase/recombinase XerC